MHISDIFKLVKQAGEVGLEIEVEGDSLPTGGIARWSVSRDGSLRGEAYEYVLSVPVTRQAVSSSLNILFNKFRKNDSVLHQSDRTSVHVHINVQDLTVTQIFTFILLFLVVEDYLVKWCGETRCGNLFCLRSRDADELLDVLYGLVKRKYTWKTLTGDNGDAIRYAAINLKALSTYGSLEFRSLRGSASQEEIEQWVDILLHIKDMARAIPSPDNIPMLISTGGMEAFVLNLLGDYHSIITGDALYREELLRKMRSLQPLMYEGDWEFFSDDNYDKTQPVEDL